MYVAMIAAFACLAVVICQDISTIRETVVPIFVAFIKVYWSWRLLTAVGVGCYNLVLLDKEDTVLCSILC